MVIAADYYMLQAPNDAINLLLFDDCFLTLWFFMYRADDTVLLAYDVRYMVKDTEY